MRCIGISTSFIWASAEWTASEFQSEIKSQVENGSERIVYREQHGGNLAFGQLNSLHSAGNSKRESQRTTNLFNHACFVPEQATEISKAQWAMNNGDRRFALFFMFPRRMIKNIKKDLLSFSFFVTWSFTAIQDLIIIVSRLYFVLEWDRFSW